LIYEKLSFSHDINYRAVDVYALNIKIYMFFNQKFPWKYKCKDAKSYYKLKTCIKYKSSNANISQLDEMINKGIDNKLKNRLLLKEMKQIVKHLI